MSTENKELVLLISKITGPTNPKFSKYLPHILRRLKNNDSEIDILLKHQDFFEILKAALTKPGCDTTILFLSILDICCCKSSFCSEVMAFSSCYLIIIMYLYLMVIHGSKWNNIQLLRIFNSWKYASSRTHPIRIVMKLRNCYPVKELFTWRNGTFMSKTANSNTKTFYRLANFLVLFPSFLYNQIISIFTIVRLLF